MRRLFLALLALGAAAQTPAAPARESPPLPRDYTVRVTELEHSHLNSPNDLRIVDALAGSYAMAGRYEKAVRLLQRALALSLPGSARQDLELKLARNQAWAGYTGRAIRTYESYLKSRPEDRAATIELIRLRRYHGDYSQAEKLCNKLLTSNPDDAEILALKAEVLHWAGGRQFLARRTADQAARHAADYPDAKVAQVYALLDLGENRHALREFAVLRDQVARRGGPGAESTYRDAFRLLERNLARPPHLVATPSYSVYNDSDGIHNGFWGWHLEAPLRDDHKLLLDLGHHRSSAPPSSIFAGPHDASFVSEFRAGGTFRAAPALHFTLLGGGSYRDSRAGLRPVFNFQISASPIDRWSFELASGREFLAVTPRAMDLDIWSYKLAGGVQYAFDARTSLAVRGDRHYWSDDNRSAAGEAALRRILHYYKPFMVDAGLLTYWEKFDRDTRFSSGFFTPESYRRHDGFLGLHGELGRWTTYELRGSAGAQRIAHGADYRPDWEVTSALTFRLGRSLRLSAGYQRRNYSLLARHGWYQGFHFSLGI